MQSAQQISLDEALRLSGRADSYARIDVLMGAPVSRADRFQLLGQEWTCCDNVWRWRPEIRCMLREASRDELDSMMDAQERKALAQLPARFAVYRGCYSLNRAGLSWTTDRAVAEKFPTLMRYRVPGNTPILRAGFVRRDRVVLKLDRTEAEIIAHHVHAIREFRLSGS